MEPPLYALISDLHSNLEAVEAVFEDMAAFPVEAVFCLGDVIGYGPNPREVLEAVRDVDLILMGNHEEGLLFYAEDFNPRARQALEWTKDQLNLAEYPREENYGLWELLDGLPKSERREGATLVHGSLRNETKDYVMPEDIGDGDKMGEIWAALQDRVCFFGHTHIPGVWTENGRFLRPAEVNGEFALGEEKVLVNVGSVGQPRDADTRASYVLVDGERVIFRRVEYDYKSTMRKILRTGVLSDTLAARLKVGR